MNKGGALHYFSHLSDFDTLINCIFWNNTAENEGNIIYTHNQTNLFFSHCLVDVDSCNQLITTGLGTNSVDCDTGTLFQINPKFVDADNGNLTLSYCSPAINAGTLNGLEELNILQDLAGNPRILKGIPDLGAFEVPGFTLDTLVTPITCFGEADGIIQITPVNGVAPFEFDWENGATTSILTDLEVGTYPLTVTDVNNCSSTTSVMLIEPALLTFEITITHASTPTSADGSLVLSNLLGGVLPYEINWSTGDTLFVAENLVPDFYGLMIEDANGCVIDTTFEVSFDTEVIEAEIPTFTFFSQPNPVAINQQFILNIQSLRTTLMTLQVFDITGQQVLEEILNVNKGHSKHLLTSPLNTGVYFIRLIDNEKFIQTHKFIVTY